MDIKTSSVYDKDTKKTCPLFRSGCEKLTNHGITRFFVVHDCHIYQVKQINMNTKDIILWHIDTVCKKITYMVVRGTQSMEKSWAILTACSHGLWTPKDFVHSAMHVDWLPWTSHEYKDVLEDSITHGFRLTK